MLRVLFDSSETHYQNLIVSTDEADEVSIADITKHIAKSHEFSGRLIWDLEMSDGQYKKTAANTQMRVLFPDFCFTPIEEGIQKTVQWFLENRETGNIRV
jgi:GDP-L-fucose synthase